MKQQETDIAKRNNTEESKAVRRSQLVVAGHKVGINFPETADKRVLNEIRKMALSGATHV
jgi:hypothetical protein